MPETREIRRTYVRLDGEIPCMIYEPRHPDGKIRVSIALMHSDDDYFEFAPALALAERGYRVFTAHFGHPSIPLDEKLRQLSVVTGYARRYPGSEKLLLLGHSGGATLMSAYQAVAERGAEVFQGPEKIIRLDDMEPFLPADGVMFLDSNFGNGAMSLLSLDPSVTDEWDGMRRDPELDLLNPRNGCAGEGCHFEDAFVRKYQRAQGERMNRLIQYAQQRVRLIDAGKGFYADDEPMMIPGGTQIAPANKLFPQMTKFFSHTEKEWPLIHQDGRITVQVVPCVRSARPASDTTGKYRAGTLVTSVKTFLKSSAVAALPDYGYNETSLYGVDWNSSYCVTTGNVRHIAAPMLIMGMTGSYEYIAAEHLYNMAERCADKTLAFVEGAGHMFTADTSAGRDWGDTVRTCFDYVNQWITRRFA